MATKIVTKNSSTASAVPTASDLVQGELAVNVADKRLFTEDNAGAIVELGTNPSGNVTFQDNGKAIFGAGSDLQIYHDGSNSRIHDAGTGVLLLQTDGTGVQIKSDGSESIADFNKNGGVNLYYDNAAKLATTSTGIDVTGTATMDGLTVDGVGRFNNNSNENLFLGDTLSATRSSLQISGVVNYFNANIDSASHGIFAWRSSSAYTERMRIDASGNVGIGTSSPAAPLDVVSSSGAVGAYIRGRSSDNIGSVYFTSNASAATEYGYVQGRSSDLRIQGFNNGLMLQPSGGNVGIGVTPNAVADLHVADTSDARIWLDATSADTMELYSGNGVGMFNRSNSYLMLGTNNTERMRIDSAGNVGIGTTSPSQKLSVVGNGMLQQNQGYFYLSDVGTGNAGIYVRGTGTSNELRSHSTGIFTWEVTGNEKMRIDSAGRLLHQTTSSTSYPTASVYAMFGVGGDATLRLGGYGGSHTMIQFLYAGNNSVGTIISTATSTSYNTSSDQRLKDNIADADDAGSKIDAIQVRQYDWKADGSHQDYGMVAQELQLVAPEAVSGDADSEDMMGVDYSKLVPMLVKEIQSLRNRVAQLEE